MRSILPFLASLLSMFSASRFSPWKKTMLLSPDICYECAFASNAFIILKQHGVKADIFKSNKVVQYIFCLLHQHPNLGTQFSKWLPLIIEKVYFHFGEAN